jgi:hypothetical protein
LDHATVLASAVLQIATDSRLKCSLRLPVFFAQDRLNDFRRLGFGGLQFGRARRRQSPAPGPEADQNIGYSDHFMHKYWHFIDKPFSTDGSALEQPSFPNAQTQIALFRKALASS